MNTTTQCFFFLSYSSAAAAYRNRFLNTSHNSQGELSTKVEIGCLPYRIFAYVTQFNTSTTATCACPDKRFSFVILFDIRWVIYLRRAEFCRYVVSPKRFHFSFLYVRIRLRKIILYDDVKTRKIAFEYRATLRRWNVLKKKLSKISITPCNRSKNIFHTSYITLSYNYIIRFLLYYIYFPQIWIMSISAIVHLCPRNDNPLFCCYFKNNSYAFCVHIQYVDV